MRSLRRGLLCSGSFPDGRARELFDLEFRHSGFDPGRARERVQSRDSRERRLSFDDGHGRLP